MTNMTNTKPGVIETNDFGYYMQLKKQDVPVIFTGDAEKTLTLWRDLTDQTMIAWITIGINFKIK